MLLIFLKKALREQKKQKKAKAKTDAANTLKASLIAKIDRRKVDSC